MSGLNIIKNASGYISVIKEWKIFLRRFSFNIFWYWYLQLRQGLQSYKKSTRQKKIIGVRAETFTSLGPKGQSDIVGVRVCVCVCEWCALPGQSAAKWLTK